MVDHKEVNENGMANNKPDEWIVPIKQMLAKVNRPSKLSIYKVPNKLVKLKEDSYTPSIVSIGPFHHRNKELLAFEEHKQRYMLHLFSRKPELAAHTLDECANELLELEGDARRCYSEHIDFDKHKLVEILLVDGCFILELFLRYSNIDNYKDKVANPIVNNARTVATLQHDLALLENQIPFVVLETLFDTINKSLTLPHTLTTYALLFFQSTLGLSRQAVESKSPYLTGDHLLHILHNFYLLHKSHLPISDRSRDPRSLQISGFKYCAAQLLKAGIQFQRNTDDVAEENFLDIEFPGGVVKMPTLRIQEATESIFRNLIAFEQCSIGTSHFIASYVFLMRSLLSSSHDAEILHDKNIIKYDLNGNGSGSHEDVATLFKSMCDGVVLKDSCFLELCQKVNVYHKSWSDWRRLKAIVMVKCREYMLVLPTKYFTNPWTTMSVLAAGLILIFTFMQTYYAARTYYHH